MGLKYKAGLRGGGYPAVGSRAGGNSVGDAEYGFTFSGTSFTTLTEDLYCDNLIIHDTFVLLTAGFRIFCRGSVHLFDSAVISCNGNNGIGGGGSALGGAALPSHSVGGSYAGGNGTATVGGTSSGTSYISGAQAPGGVGGDGISGAGGGSGPSAFDEQEFGSLIQPSIGDSGYVVGDSGFTYKVMGGTGGGGGGGDGAIKGGGGGGGGGVIYIEAQDLVMEGGQITANGGVGGSSPSAGCGGGGGGGGGLIILKINDIYLRGGSAGTKITVNGGAGGTGGNMSGLQGIAGYVVYYSPRKTMIGNTGYSADLTTLLP